MNIPGLGENMQGMLKQLQEMQHKIARVQDELEMKTVTAESGGGMVTVIATGKQKIRQIKIERDALNPEDIDMLEDLIVAAVNKALAEAALIAQADMAKATSGILPNIPGLSLPGF
jgi:nucleoid-associated protein EbfC